MRARFRGRPDPGPPRGTDRRMPAPHRVARPACRRAPLGVTWMANAPVDVVDVVEHALVDHHLRSPGPLLAGLEHEADPRPASASRRCVQEASRADEHRGVRVVAAGVHRARRPRTAKDTPVSSVERQRVHVGAEHQRGARPRALEVGDDRRGAGAEAGREAEGRGARRDRSWVRGTSRPSSGWRCSSRRSSTASGKLVVGRGEEVGLARHGVHATHQRRDGCRRGQGILERTKVLNHPWAHCRPHRSEDPDACSDHHRSLEGFGRALAERSRRRLGPRHRRPRRRPPRAAAAAEPDRRHVVAIAGDVTDPAHRAALVDAADAARRLDLIVNNASTLGPSPLPRLAVLPARRLRATCCDLTWWRRSRSSSRPAAAAPQRRHDRRHHLRRRGRGLRGLGRLRLLEGRARPAPDVLAAEHPDPRLLGRSGRHAHRRCTRTPSPARTSPTAAPGDGRAGPAPAAASNT